MPSDKSIHKKDFYDNNAIQSIKSELLNNNVTLSASSKVFNSQDQSYNSISYEEDDFNNDNIDVETDSDTDQQITELKQMNYHNLSDVTMKHEEWSKIVKSTMLKSPKIATANESYSPADDQHHQHEKKVLSEMKIDADPDSHKCSDEVKTNLKRVFTHDEDDDEYFHDTFTNQNLLNLSDRKRGKYGNGRGFSIENIIGRIVEDR